MITEYRHVVSIALALVIVACGQDKQDETIAAGGNEQPADAINGLEQGLATIDRDGIEAHLKYLADDALMGRMTGAPEYDEAAAYVAGHFAEIGLDQAGDDGWYQAVPMLARRIDVNSAKVVFHQRDFVGTALDVDADSILGAAVDDAVVFDSVAVGLEIPFAAVAAQ